MYFYQRDVLAYHSRFNCLIGNVKAPAIANGLFRKNFILEEGKEFREALLAEDAIEMADGLCDSLYVTIGAAIEFGINIVTHVPQLQDNRNPSPGMGLIDNKIFWIRRFFEAEDACAKAIDSGHVGRCAWALAGMIEVIKAAVEAWGINLRPLWREVHRTNMMKTPSGRPDVKTIKPPGWKRPQLGPILADQYGFAAEDDVIMISRSGEFLTTSANDTKGAA